MFVFTTDDFFFSGQQFLKIMGVGTPTRTQEDV